MSLSLKCLIHGDDPNRMFTVEIPKTKNVRILTQRPWSRRNLLASTTLPPQISTSGRSLNPSCSMTLDRKMLTSTSVWSCRSLPDGSITDTIQVPPISIIGDTRIVSLVLELKQEVGEGGSDPAHQVGLSMKGSWINSMCWFHGWLIEPNDPGEILLPNRIHQTWGRQPGHSLPVHSCFGRRHYMCHISRGDYRGIGT